MNQAQFEAIKTALSPAIINVTAEHITKGEQKQCGRCPIALALRDILPPDVQDKIKVAVGQMDFMIKDEDSSFVIAFIATPLAAAEFIVKFDRGARVEPFTMRLFFEISSYFNHYIRLTAP